MSRGARGGDVSDHISIDITPNLSHAETQYRRFAAFLGDLRSFWPLVVPLFIGWMREQFSTEGAFGGQPWTPLSPDYAAAKAVQYPGKGILVASGKMKKAASMPRRIVTPRTLTLSIDSDYLQYHQEGTDRMPKRPLIFDLLPAPAQAELTEAANIYVRDIAHRLGLA
jgi:hypothetical protein